MAHDKTQYLSEQVRQLYKQAPGAFVATMAVMAYVAYMVSDVLEQEMVWQWIGIILLINIYLLVWLYSVKRHGINQGNARRWLHMYQIEAVLHGLAWGMLPFMMAEAHDPLWHGSRCYRHHCHDLPCLYLLHVADDVAWHPLPGVW